jgi:hypothetical protein
MARQSNVWALMLRYQAQAERMYRRASTISTASKALRDEMSNSRICRKPRLPALIHTPSERKQPFFRLSCSEAG